MPREVEPAALEADFLRACLSQQSRLDGRSLLEGRQIQLWPASDDATVECAFGETRVSAHVSASLVSPRPDRPFEGFVTVNAEISPMASFTFDFGRSNEAEVIISRTLEKVLRRSAAIDQESLCVIAGEQVWSVRVDIHFLNDEGNLLDCACMAAIAALKRYRRPDVTVVGEELTIHSLDERAPVPLTLLHMPLCVTFGLFDPTTAKANSIMVMDPNHLESSLCSGTLTIALNAAKEICVFTKAGGQPLSVDEIRNAITLATARVGALDAIIHKALGDARVGGVTLDALQPR